MELRITATELARKLGDVLGRIRYRADRFVIERNGEPVAAIGPLPERGSSSLREALAAWKSTGGDVGPFGDDLERVNRADRPAN